MAYTINLMNNNVKEVYLGANKITEIYLGETSLLEDEAGLPDTDINIIEISTTDTQRELKLMTDDLIYYSEYTDWGDGTVDTLNTHVYSTTGTFTVKTQKWVYYFYDGVSPYDLKYREMVVNILDLCKNFKSYDYKFFYMKNALSINLTNINTNNITSMRCAFWYCQKIKSLDVSNFDTSKVTDMSYLFSTLTSIEALDVSNFDTSNVTNMSDLFYNCSLIKSLDLSNFNTSKVENMSYTFGLLSSITTLDLSNLDTSSVTNMRGILSDNPKIVNMNSVIANMNTSNVSDFTHMFKGCVSITDLNLSHFDTSNATLLIGMFFGCTNIVTLNTSSFDTSKVTNITGLFRGCSKISTLDLSNFNTSNVEYMSSMFSGCSKISTLDLSNFDTSKVTYMDYMFSECSSLYRINLSSFDTSNVTNMTSMFYKCYVIGSLDLSHFNTSNLVYMSYMFRQCNELGSLKLKGWDTSKVQKMVHTFYQCGNLTELDLSSFTSESLTDATYMCVYCYKLQNLNLSNFSFKNAISNLALAYMSTTSKTIVSDIIGATESGLSYPGTFVKDYNYVEVNVSAGSTINLTSEGLSTFRERTNWGDGTVDNLNSHTYSRAGVFKISTQKWFSDSESERACITKVLSLSDNNLEFTNKFKNLINVTEINLNNISTSHIKDMSYMFSNCKKLQLLDLSNLIYAKPLTLSHMFDGCNLLSVVNLECIDTSNVNDMSYMFNDCSSFISIDVSKFDTSNVVNMNYMFSGCSNINIMPLYNFITDNVTSTEGMFLNITSCIKIYLSKFNTVNVVNNSSMFSGVNADCLIYINDTFTISEEDSNFEGVFSDITLLYENKNIFIVEAPDNYTITLSDENLLYYDDTTDWGDGTVDTLNTHTYILGGTYNITTSKWPTLNVNNDGIYIDRMYISSMTSFANNHANYNKLFSNFTNLSSTIPDILNNKDITSADNMYENCTTISSDIVIPSNFTSVKCMFKNCTNITHVNSNWNNTYSLLSSDGCYVGCKNITHIDNEEIILNTDEHFTSERIPVSWGGYGFNPEHKQYLGFYRVIIPTDNYLIEMGENPNVATDKIIAWGDGIVDMNKNHVYERKGEYLIKGYIGTNQGVIYPAQSLFNTLIEVYCYPTSGSLRCWFSSCTKLVSVSFHNIIERTVGDYLNTFYNCNNLEKFDVGKCKTDSALDLSPCPKLDKESILGVVNSLTDRTGTTSKTLTLGSVNKAKLTAEELLIGTSKNWIIA